jgi:uncharacterized protein YjiS (DUF1127 family)
MHTIVMDRILALPAALVRGLRQEREHRAAAAALRHMGDHLLRDIGLNPGDIDGSVRRGRDTR